MGSLCQSCQSLDLPKLFSIQEISIIGTDILGTRSLTQTKQDLQCELCHFFHQLRPVKFSCHTRVRLFNDIRSLAQYDPTSKRWTRADCYDSIREPYLCVLSKDTLTDYLTGTGTDNEIGSEGLACYVDFQRPTSFQLAVVDADRINWDAIRRQLQTCRTRHPTCCRIDGSPSRLPSIKLMDCITGRIISGTLSDRYCALSYVWGKQKGPLPHMFMTPSMDDAPLTIQDAKKVVLELGMRFLWVDQYCISRDNRVEQRRAINNMDLVYENAEVTLVALHGENDRSGLPGVSAPRTRQPVFKTKYGQLVSSFPRVSSLTGESKWNSRGWTYQEARLSRRILVFTRYQVYVTCRQSTWSEAVPYNPNTNCVTWLLNSPRVWGALTGRERLEGYWRDRSNYSTRFLTYETDQLDAFRGILQRTSWITLWGVPVIPKASKVDPNTGFALGLLWTRMWKTSPSFYNQVRHIEHASGRAGFPTWSWTGLCANIDQDDAPRQSKYHYYLRGNVVDLPANEANIRFWCLMDGHELSLADAVRLSDSNMLPEYSSKLLVEGDFVRIRRNADLQAGPKYTTNDRLKTVGLDLGREDALREDEVEVEGLVLIQWQDTQRLPGTTRFVLMLLRWIDDCHAERRGLLTGYEQEYHCHLIQKLPRVRKKFMLQ